MFKYREASRSRPRAVGITTKQFKPSCAARIRVAKNWPMTLRFIGRLLPPHYLAPCGGRSPGNGNGHTGAALATPEHDDQPNQEGLELQRDIVGCSFERLGPGAAADRE